MIETTARQSYASVQPNNVYEMAQSYWQAGCYQIVVKKALKSTITKSSSLAQG